VGKRGNGEGSIYQRRDGWWSAAYTKDGKRKQLYAKTRTEVAARLTAALRARDTGEPMPVAKGTVADFVPTWLDVARVGRRRKRTVRGYERIARIHIIPRLGRVPLAKLSHEQLERLYAMKLETLSQTTVHHIHAAIHRMLEVALRKGLVARNVADQVDAPALKPKEITTLTEEELQRFIAQIAGDRLEALYLTTLTTGMRLSELLGLRWRDVDLAKREIRLRTTLERDHGAIDFVEAKTKGSRRRLDLVGITVAALRAHRVAQAKERLAAGPDWNDRDLVFTNELGGPVADQTFRRGFHRHLAAAGCPEIRIHDGRHTCFTILLGRGVHPKIVSEMAGHSRISTTMDLYSHVTPTMQRAAIMELEKAIGGER
jgi:integrase